MQEVATTRVEVVGAGPGGLYAALLLARAGAEVRVHERNPPGETFGFGVVFSEATLGELATADAPSHAAFLAASARWDPVAIRRAGTEIRAHGNAFAAIGRHALLDVLERRAVELGVEVCHRHEADAGALDGADLVVVAEGARSASRDARRAAFRPRATREGSTFIWLGTHQPFDAFTFIFLETPDGPFTAHIYPYAANRATFIVETDRDTWRKAGLDRVRAEDLAPGESDQHSIAVLSELFADHLGGHPLDGNGSYWRDWATIRTATWRDGNVVLLGDAAHTAHFSIGSGTKLALEDAIALARWVGEEPELATALLRYEGERRPRVERVQAAASTSLDWFARHRRYAHFPPEQFAYSLLTRSARVDHDNLRRRDPALVRGVDAKLAGSSGGLSGMSDNHRPSACGRGRGQGWSFRRRPGFCRCSSVGSPWSTGRSWWCATTRRRSRACRRRGIATRSSRPHGRARGSCCWTASPSRPTAARAPVTPACGPRGTPRRGAARWARRASTPQGREPRRARASPGVWWSCG